MAVFCSTVIATIGRPSLAVAVESVLAQTCPEDFEVIVVNDSGQPLPPAAWQASPRVRVIETQRRERCVARNAGAALARGAFLNIIDDDDWLLPGALEAWYAATRARPATWYIGASQLVNRAGQLTIQHRPTFEGNVLAQAMAGEWLPLQASVIDMQTFFAAGGFDPHALYADDNDLCRRLALTGTVVCLPALVAGVALGQTNSTSDPVLRRQRGWATREHVLDDRRCFARMRSSATEGYWQGRVVRCYLTSAWWNARRGQGLRALSRVGGAGAALLLAAPHWLAPRFWRAVARAYDNPTFARGLSESSLAA